MDRTRDYISVAEKVLQERFPDADCAFVAGSIVTGDDTPSSDIDLIVLYNDHTHESYRESIIKEKWPVEIFVHNLISQDYFFQEDQKTGGCSTMTMVTNGIVIGKNQSLAESRKQIAYQLIAQGPLKLTQEQIDWLRYSITDLFDDLRHPKDKDYVPAILAMLLDKAGDFYLRAQGKWSGRGKQLIKILKKENPEFAHRFLAAFKQAQNHDINSLEKILIEILKPYNGFLFENYKSICTSWHK